MAKEVTRLKKVCKLGDKELKLLKILSSFELIKTKDLKSQVPTEDYIHLKKALMEKIEKEGWTIETVKGSGLNPDSFYKLVRLIVTKNTS